MVDEVFHGGVVFWKGISEGRRLVVDKPLKRIRSRKNTHVELAVCFSFGVRTRMCAFFFLSLVVEELLQRANRSLGPH